MFVALLASLTTFAPVEPGMDPLPPVRADDLIAALREKFERLCRDVTDAVNRAPPGHVISHSEEPVRDLLGDSRQEVYQAALETVAE